MNSSKWKQPERISKLVESLISRWRGQQQASDGILNTVWLQIVGEKIAKHAKPLQINGSKLVIIVESAAWMNELTFLKEKIKIEAKNRLFEYGIKVSEVLFRLG
jgi:predicted nucleic acid-binding Zn ribbon protein